MSLLEEMLQQIPQLSREDRATLREHLDQIGESIPGYGSAALLAPLQELFPDKDSEDMSEEELNEFIREVVEEVRQELYDRRSH